MSPRLHTLKWLREFFVIEASPSNMLSLSFSLCGDIQSMFHLTFGYEYASYLSAIPVAILKSFPLRMSFSLGDY